MGIGKFRTAVQAAKTIKSMLPDSFFEDMKILNQNLGLSELSMGMSSDFLIAAKHLATYIRVGSSIFGQRS